MGKMACVIILLIIFGFVSPVIGGDSISDNISIREPIVYKVYIDKDHGFYRVYNQTSDKAVLPYINRTLNIYKGDTIIWENDAVPDMRMTIVSKQNLWDTKEAFLSWSYRKFSYTFNKSGIYDIYIKEKPKLLQTIIVGPLDLNKTKTNDTKTNDNKLNLSSNLSIKNSSIKANSSNDSYNKTNKTVTRKNSTNETILDESKTISYGLMPGFETILFNIAIIAALSSIYILRKKRKNKEK